MVQDEELARQLVELGFRGNGEVLKREEFEARKRAAEEARSAQRAKEEMCVLQAILPLKALEAFEERLGTGSCECIEKRGAWMVGRASSPGKSSRNEAGKETETGEERQKKEGSEHNWLRGRGTDKKDACAKRRRSRKSYPCERNRNFSRKAVRTFQACVIAS